MRGMDIDRVGGGASVATVETQNECHLTASSPSSSSSYSRIAAKAMASRKPHSR